MLRENAPRKGFFEPEQFEAVLAHLSERLRAIAIFGYCNGWRRGDILGREWRHVDWKAGVIRLDPGETKNDDGRTLPYDDGQHDALVEVIEAAWATHERLATKGLISPLKCSHSSGQANISARTSRAFVGHGRRPVATPDIRRGLFHDFRRAMARNLTRTGQIDPTVAMLLTGHKTRSVFDRYNIGNENDVRRALGTVLGTVGQFERPSPDRKSQKTFEKRLRARSSAG